MESTFEALFSAFSRMQKTSEAIGGLPALTCRAPSQFGGQDTTRRGEGNRNAREINSLANQSAWSPGKLTQLSKSTALQRPGVKANSCEA